MTNLTKISPGDSVLVVSSGRWGPNRYQVCTVAKVHKTGHIILDGGTKWRVSSGIRVDSASRYSREQLMSRDAALEAKMDADLAACADRQKLNRLGKAFGDIRDDAEGAAIWRGLPDHVRAMIGGE